MKVTLPADLRSKVEQELASGRYRSGDKLIEQAVRQFFEERQRGQQRLDALCKIGKAVDHAGLYERVLLPGQE
jgi:Arc/MetJ-type ribon-helix-helix transcriptional regulator